MDKKQLTEKARLYGTVGFRLTVKAVVLHIIFVTGGFLAGIAGGWWGAVFFDWSGWLTLLCALLGAVIGGIGGYFLAQVVMVGIIQDMLLDAGIEAGKVGYRKAKTLLQERRQKD